MFRLSQVTFVASAAVLVLGGCSTTSNSASQGSGDTATMTLMSDTDSEGVIQPEDSGLPVPGIELKPGRFAFVVTDPQVDFLSPDGVAWGVVGASVEKNGTVPNLGRLFTTADQAGIPTFISPHYYFPHDHRQDFGGTLEHLMHDIHMFDRKGQLDLTNFDGSGADWMEEYKSVIYNGRTIVTSPHKVYGPESNDLAFQLRKKNIDQVILAGMSANLCVESHMRELIEQGFEVVVVADATAAAQVPGYDGYQAAVINFTMIASDVWTTEEAVARMRAGK